MAGVRLVWERVRWEVRQGQVVWMEFRIPAHVAVPGSLLQVKALCQAVPQDGGGVFPKWECGIEMSRAQGTLQMSLDFHRGQRLRAKSLGRGLGS